MVKKLLSTPIIFTGLSIIASAINFFYYPVISHFLTTAEFGDVQIGVSFIMITAALFTSLNAVALYVSANGSVSDAKGLYHIEKVISFISGILALVTVALASPLSELLNLQDSSLLYILAIIFMVNIPAATWIGSLQGNGQFIASGWIGFASALIKILASALLISIGWGAHGALIGMLFGFIIVLPLVRVLQKKPIASFRRTLSLIAKQDVLYLYNNRSLVLILLGLTIATIISSLDVTFAKIYLDPYTAGTYAQASTAAKIPYFTLLPAAIVLFEGFVRRTRSVVPSFLVFFTLAVIGSLLTIFLQNILLGVLFSQPDKTGAFSLLVVTFSSYSVFTLLMYILIARGAVMRLFITSIASITITLLLLSLDHNSPLAIARSFSFGLLGSLCLVIIMAVTSAKSHTN